MMCPTAGMLHMSQTYTIVYSNKVHNTVKIYHVLKSEEEVILWGKRVFTELCKYNCFNTKDNTYRILKKDTNW